MDALMIAVAAEDFDWVRDILASGDLNGKDWPLISVLYHAVRSGNCEIAKLLLNQSNHFARDYQYCKSEANNVFDSAIRSLDINMLEVLMESKFVPERCTFRCRSSVLSHEELQILDSISNLHFIDWHATLKEAVMRNNFQLVDYVLDEAKNFTSNFNNYLLKERIVRAALTGGNAVTLRKILEHNCWKHIGVQISALNSHKCLEKADIFAIITAREVFLTHNNFYDACLHGSYNEVQLGLQEHFSHPDTLNLGLIVAVQCDHIDIVKFLLESRLYDPGIITSAFVTAARYGSSDMMEVVFPFIKLDGGRLFSCQGSNILHCAVASGKLENVQYLIGLNQNFAAIDINEVEDKRTALHLAVLSHKNSLPMVQFLVENGACVNVLDDAGRSPLSLACSVGNLSLVSYLLLQGADTCLECFDLYGYDSALLSAFQHLMSDDYAYDRSKQLAILKLVIDAVSQKGQLSFEISHIIMDGFVKVKQKESEVNYYIYGHAFHVPFVPKKRAIPLELPMCEMIFENIPRSSVSDLSSIHRLLDRMSCFTRPDDDAWSDYDLMLFVDLVFETFIRLDRIEHLMTLLSDGIVEGIWLRNSYLGRYVSKKLCGLADENKYVCDIQFSHINRTYNDRCCIVDIVQFLRFCGLENKVNSILEELHIDTRYKGTICDSTPISLQEISRVHIRRQMYKHCGNIEPNINKLPLPEDIKRYIHFEERLPSLKK